jgi:hypothetical protein
MNEVILRKSVLLLAISTIMFISIGLALVCFNHNKFGLIARKGEAVGIIFIIVSFIKFLFDFFLYKIQYVKVSSSGIYDNSSIFMSYKYYWHNIVKLEVSDSGIIIHENQSIHEINGLYINNENIKYINKYRNNNIMSP